MPAVNRNAAAGRELGHARRIPYTAHVAEGIVKTTADEFVQTWRIAGTSFETSDDAELNAWHERINVTWRNIASTNVALWMHVVRRRERPTAKAPAAAESDFAGQLSAKYQKRLAGETLMMNDLYLSIVYRPLAGAATSLASKALVRRERQNELDLIADALDACEKLGQTVSASLSRYEPEPLTTYQRSGRHYSHLLEFFGLLINGESQPIVLPRIPLGHLLGTTRPLFGSEVIEYRTPTCSRLGAMLGVKEYPASTSVGMFDALLSAPFECVFTQSFSFLSKAAGQGVLQRQYNRMSNAGDFAVSQAEELKDALDQLTANEFVLGDHHLTLQVLSDSFPAGSTVADDTRTLKRLNDDLAHARALLADTGMTVAREDLALESAFWAQLPGAFQLRPRRAPITSRNIAAMAPWHNHPSGRATGNHWGDALALLITRARSPYYFSLHASDPSEPDGGSRKDTGHTFIVGPTGCGKTVVIGFLVSLLARQNVTQVIFDKDYGLEICVRALGGRYFRLRNGEPTGFNPLQLEPTPHNVEFMQSLLRMLARGPAPFTTRELTDLEQALRGTLALDRSARRMSRLIEFTDPTRSEGVHARLARWCYSTGGEYAWAFDCEEDLVVPDLASHATIGFDVTHFLSHDLLRGPVNRYLFHLVEQLLDGRRLVCWVDEFSNALSDPDFQSFADNGPKTWRKLDGSLCVATQAVKPVLSSRIARTIVESTATKIYFPNADASREDYVDGLGLTEREFKLVKEELEPGSGMFIVKQGHWSVIVQLDLRRGFEPEIAVISGRKSTVEQLHRMMAAVGDDPAQWLPGFMAGHSTQ